MSDYDYHQEAVKRAAAIEADAEYMKKWAKRESDYVVRFIEADAAHTAESNRLEGSIRKLLKGAIVVSTITILFGAAVALVGCGGGECDQSCRDTIDQAHGKMTIEPVAHDEAAAMSALKAIDDDEDLEQCVDELDDEDRDGDA